MTHLVQRSIRLGYCDDKGIGITDKTYTLEEAIKMVKVMNDRARIDAERGRLPNTVYWIHENYDNKEKKIGA